MTPSAPEPELQHDDEPGLTSSHPMMALRNEPAGAAVEAVRRAQKAKVFGALFRKPKTQRFGRYAVLDVLGQGGMGTVLKAYDEELDRAIAIKLLNAEAAERHASRLKREAQALAKLSHPNVVQVHEVGNAPEHRAWPSRRGTGLRKKERVSAKNWKKSKGG